MGDILEELPRGEVGDDWVVGAGRGRRRAEMAEVLPWGQSVAARSHAAVSCKIFGEEAIVSFGRVVSDDTTSVQGEAVSGVGRSGVFVSGAGV